MTSDKASAAVAIMVSLLVSFTLTPMMSARLLKADEAAGAHDVAKSRAGFYGWIELVVLFVPDDAVWLVLIAGTLASIALGWWLGASIHRRSIRRFKEANPGLGPLIGGDYD